MEFQGKKKNKTKKISLIINMVVILLKTKAPWEHLLSRHTQTHTHTYTWLQHLNKIKLADTSVPL